MARPIKSIHIVRQLFIRLHDALLEKFIADNKDQGVEFLPEYIRYGYNLKEHQKNKPTLVKDMQKNSRVDKYLTDKYGNQWKENKKVIDGYYLKTRYQDCIKLRKSIIKVADTHATIFFLYLGFEGGISEWLESLKENASHQLLEVIHTQHAILNPASKDDKFITTYSCYYYSTNRGGIYKLSLNLDMTPALSDDFNTKGAAFNRYGVTAEEIEPKKARYATDKYEGFATVKDDVLYINLEAVRKNENLYIVLPIMDEAYLDDMDFVLGGYTGRSHTRDIISGEIILQRSQEDHSNEYIPPFIKNYLYAKRSQNRAHQKQYKEDDFKVSANKAGRGRALSRLAEHTYFRVFVLTESEKRQGYDLAELSLTLKDDFSFVMSSRKRKFRGLVKLRQQSLFTFRGKDSDIYFFAAYDVKGYVSKNKDSALFEGSFIWTEAEQTNLYGRTLLAFSDSKVNPRRYIDGKHDEDNNEVDPLAAKAFKWLMQFKSTRPELSLSD